jgi:Uma2 family endonuclease
MNAPAPLRLTVDAYLAWAGAQPARPRHELVRGRIVEMAAEKNLHAIVKGDAFVALRSAIRNAGLSCTVFPDGAGVRVGADSLYEPDVTVTCAAFDPQAVWVPEPVILVEVLSPGTERCDLGVKLADYFRLPSTAHYLILDPEAKLVVWHARAGEALRTSTHEDGTLRLDPPGLTLAVGDLFASV